MAPELTPGAKILYQGIPADIVELVSHDKVVVDAGSIGMLEVKRSDLIVLQTPEKVLADTKLAKISDSTWHEAKRRADAAKRIAALQQGKSVAVEAEAKLLGLSVRQLWRLVEEYETHETISSLMPRTVGRKPGTRVLAEEVDRIIVDKIDNFWLVPERPAIQDLFERIGVECRKQGFKAPCRSTVRERLRAYEHHDAQRRRLGSKASKYIYTPMPGHVDVNAPLERVEIDHTMLDVMVRSDDAHCGYVGRPWLTLAIDVYSRCILGMHIGFEPPSVLSVALCLTHACLPKNPAAEFGVPLGWPMDGLPKEIVVDNGKDFTSRAFQRSCDEHGIILSFRPVGSPHYGGTIERLIGTMVGKCRLLPGTTKNSAKAKGDYNSAKHAALTLSEVRRWFVEQILGGYHTHEHRMLRIPPEVKWEQTVELQDAA